MITKSKKTSFECLQYAMPEHSAWLMGFSSKEREVEAQVFFFFQFGEKSLDLYLWSFNALVIKGN